MSSRECLRCGKVKLEGELYCPQCQAELGRKRPKKIWIFSLIFSALLLILTGLLIWHKGFLFHIISLEKIWPRPVARINGEPIYRPEFKERVEMIKEFLGRQYGKEIFKGEEGCLLVADLEKKVLGEMVEEKLIAQEARRLGISVEEEEVQREIEAMGKKVSGSVEMFQSELKNDKYFMKNLQNYVRHLLILNALNLAKASSGASVQENLTSWLRQAKQKAQIEIYGWKDFPEGQLFKSCCIGGRSAGNCRGSRQGKMDPVLEDEIKAAALQAFRKENPDAQNITAKVIDYGCHIQVDIQKDSQVVKSYIYQNGKVEDL